MPSMDVSISLISLFAFIVARLDKQKIGAETLCDVACQESGKLFFTQQLC